MRSGVLAENEAVDAVKHDFDPISHETTDINQALMRFSKEKEIPVGAIDFDIENVYTIAENSQENSSIIYNMAVERNVPSAILSSSEISLRQTYVIKFKPLAPNPMAKLEFTMSADKYFTKIIAKIKKESRFVYTNKLAEYIYEELNKKAARYKILLYVFEEDLCQRIDEFARSFEHNPKLESDETILFCECREFKPSIDDRLVRYYEQKHVKKESEERVDLYNRDFIYDVSNGEVLVEYIKPKMGISGRNCRGEFLKVEEPKALYLPDFKITHAIDRVEDDGSVKYIALTSGYLSFSGDLMDIKDELKVQEISFRKTGSIIVDEEKDITLDITEKNPIVDAIGSNMTAKATTIIVHGSMGESSKVYAESATIEGLTHKTSQVYAKSVKINIHKGFAEGEEVNITNIEGGRVVAEMLTAGDLTNAEIRAKKVFIENLGSNNNITASELIQIKNITGSDNFLNIEPSALPRDVEELERLDTKRAELKKITFEKKTQYEKLAHYVKENKRSAMKIKEMIESDKKQGRVPHEAFMRKFEHFLKLVEKFKETKNQLDEMNAEMENLEHEIAIIQDRILSARVVNLSVWINYQVVNFKLSLHSEPIRYLPPEGQKIKFIGIMKLADGKYEVGPIKSDSKVEQPGLKE